MPFCTTKVPYCITFMSVPYILHGFDRKGRASTTVGTTAHFFQVSTAVPTVSIVLLIFIECVGCDATAAPPFPCPYLYGSSDLRILLHMHANGPEIRHNTCQGYYNFSTTNTQNSRIPIPGNCWPCGGWVRRWVRFRYVPWTTIFSAIYCAHTPATTLEEVHTVQQHNY